MAKIKSEYLLLALIFAFAAFLRFYRLEEMAGFSFDQEYAANFAYSVLKEFPIQLIGQGLSLQGLFMGPLYFYYLVPFFAATNLHPIGGAIGSVIFGLITIGVYFYVSKKIFNIQAALIIALLRTVLYTELEHDWGITPAFSSDLVIVITWFLFYKYWHGSTKIFSVIGLIFGLYSSIHPILFPFYFVFIALLLIKRRLPNLKITLISIIAFILPNLSLIIFEYLRNFLQVKQIIELFTGPSLEQKGGFQISSYLLFNLGEPSRILGANLIPKEIFLSIFFLILFSLIFKSIGFWKDHFHSVMLLLTFTIFITYYALYPAHVPEYYFIALTTLMIIYIGASLSLLLINNRILPSLILFLLLGNIIFTNLKLISGKWNNPSLGGIAHRDFIVKEILTRQPKDQEFIVTYITHPGWNFGFDYFFKLYGHEPQKTQGAFRPPTYTIVTPKHLSEGAIDIPSGDIGLILPK